MIHEQFNLSITVTGLKLFFCVCVIMATNFLELATTLKYLGAKWLPEKRVNFTPCYLTVALHFSGGFLLDIVDGNIARYLDQCKLSTLSFAMSISIKPQLSNTNEHVKT